MGRRKNDDPEELAARLLRQPQRAAIDELLDAIRRVNPTGLELSAAEAKRRYRSKAALQSLLLRRFPDEVTIVREPDRDGVVLLRHRYADRGGAAHAVVAELDEDARSIVQRRLDTGEGDEEPVAAQPSGRARARPPRTADRDSDDDSVTDLLRQGDAARESYDYEAARQHYDAALVESRGSLAAALPLIELLIDFLAADEAALAIAPRLAADAAEDMPLRAKLALAAARMGDHAQVEWWLRGVSAADSAAAWLALTVRAISDGRADDAAACLKCARDAGALAAEVVQREAEIIALRRARWSTTDADLDRLLAAGDFERAEAGAHEVLAHWPEAPVARRIIGLAKERRRTADGDRLLGEAQQALARGDTAAAAERSACARAIGVDTSVLDAAVIAAVETARHRRGSARVSVGVLRHRRGAA